MLFLIKAVSAVTKGFSKAASSHRKGFPKVVEVDNFLQIFKYCLQYSLEICSCGRQRLLKTISQHAAPAAVKIFSNQQDLNLRTPQAFGTSNKSVNVSKKFLKQEKFNYFKANQTQFHKRYRFTELFSKKINAISRETVTLRNSKM